MASSKLFLIALIGALALVCAATARELSATDAETVNVGADDSKLDITLGQAPSPKSIVIGINGSISISAPGLAAPPSKLVSIGTNNNITIGLPHVAKPPL
jgi:hypothetical protein